MTSRPLSLTDAELTHVFEAARPIPVERRDAFLEQVASLLRACTEVGPGTVHRAIERAQREHFDPPDFEEQRARSRWDRDVPGFERASKRAV